MASLSVESDPSVWKAVSGWLWALLAVPMLFLWNKATGAVQKDELEKVVKEFKDSMEKHQQEDKETRKDIRETQRLIFSRLDSQDKLLARIDTTLSLTLQKQDRGHDQGRN